MSQHATPSSTGARLLQRVPHNHRRCQAPAQPPHTAAQRQPQVLRGLTQSTKRARARRRGRHAALPQAPRHAAAMCGGQRRLPVNPPACPLDAQRPVGGTRRARNDDDLPMPPRRSLTDNAVDACLDRTLSRARHPADSPPCVLRYSRSIPAHRRAGLGDLSADNAAACDRVINSVPHQGLHDMHAHLVRLPIHRGSEPRARKQGHNALLLLHHAGVFYLRVTHPVRGPPHTHRRLLLLAHEREPGMLLHRFSRLRRRVTDVVLAHRGGAADRFTQTGRGPRLLLRRAKVLGVGTQRGITNHNFRPGAPPHGFSDDAAQPRV